MARPKKSTEADIQSETIEKTTGVMPVELPIPNILEIFGYYTKEQIEHFIQKAYDYDMFKKIDKSLFTPKDLLCIIGVLNMELTNSKNLIEAKNKEIENIQNFYKKQSLKPISREDALKVLTNTDSWAPQAW